MSKQKERVRDTLCKNCFFAQYDGDTQVGCNAGQLDFIDEFRPGSIIEAYDETKEFYVLKKTCCLLYRTKEWEYNSLDAIESAIEEVLIPFHILIVCNNSIDDFNKTINSINIQKIKTFRLTIIYPIGCNLHIKDIRKIMNKSDIKIWDVRKIINPDYSSIERYIDLVSGFVKAPFICALKKGGRLPHQFLYNIKQLIIRSLQFNILNFDDGFVVSYPIYKYTKLMKEQNESWIEILNNKHPIEYKDVLCFLK